MNLVKPVKLKSDNKSVRFLASFSLWSPNVSLHRSSGSLLKLVFTPVDSGFGQSYGHWDARHLWLYPMVSDGACYRFLSHHFDLQQLIDRVPGEAKAS